MRYFCAVAEDLNYRAASARLNLSAPALSKQVRDLEEEIGVRLFDRDTSHVRLTRAGQAFLTEARQILSQAQRAVAVAREAAKGQRGRLVIGNIGPLTAGFMPDAVAAFYARFPGVEVELTDIELPGQLAALEKQVIDIALMPARSTAELSSRFRHESVLTTPLGVALSREHPLASARSLAFAELGREKMICFVGDTAASSHRRYVAQLFVSRGLKPPRFVEVRGFESLLAMVAGGQGVSILAVRGSMSRMNGVVTRPLKDGAADTEIDLHAVWRAGADAAVAEHFVAEFRRRSGAAATRGNPAARARSRRT